MSRVKGRNFDYYREIATDQLSCDSVVCMADNTVEVSRYNSDVIKKFNNKREFISWVVIQLYVKESYATIN